MFEAFVQGLLSYCDVVALGFLMLGVAIGIFVGILPAVGGMVAMALLLPLTSGLDRVAALSLLMGIYAISSTGDSICSILVGIPGAGPSAATLIDGFPMTQKGQSGQALGAMLGSASMGAILGVILAMGVIPIARPLVLNFGSPEMFALVLMGISFLAVLGRGSALKGLISGLVGVFVALIGFQHATGVGRFTFDSTFLLWGFTLVPIAMGLFAGAELLDLAIKEQSIVPAQMVRVGKELRHDILQGIKAVFHLPWLWFRSCVLGYVIGVLPGIGASTATFVAYGQAKQTCKDPGTFGTGRIEGVIAPEASNNAKEGGALLTTLALGIPGSSAMALLLAALLMQGISPGPKMMQDELGLVFTLFWGLALANIIGGVLCYVIMGYFNLIKIISLPPRYLVPIIMTLAYFGAFSINQDFGDMIVTLAFTFIGFLMKKFGFNRPAMLLGFVLGRLFENYFFLSLQTRGPLFLLRPVVLAILAITFSLYAVEPIRSLMARRRARRMSR